MSPEAIIAVILVALVLAAVAVVRAAELDAGPRRVRLLVLAAAATLGTLAIVPIVGLIESADWSWLALGPLLGCASVTLGPPVVRVLVKVVKRRGDRL